MSSYWRCRGCDEIGEGEAPFGHCRSGDDGHGNMIPIHCGPCDPVVILPVEEYELLRSVYLERVAQADELERLRGIEAQLRDDALARKIAGATFEAAIYRKGAINAYRRAVLGEKEAHDGHNV